MSTQPTTPAPVSISASLARLPGAVIVSLAFLFVALVLGLVWLAGPSGRSETLAWLSGVFALVASGFSAASVYQNRQLSSSVETVRTQTNGSLDARIQTAIAQALAAVGATPQTPVAVTPPLVLPTGIPTATVVTATPAPSAPAAPAAVAPVPAVLTVTPAGPVAFAPADTLSHVPVQPGPTAGS